MLSTGFFTKKRAVAFLHQQFSDSLWSLWKRWFGLICATLGFFWRIFHRFFSKRNWSLSFWKIKKKILGPIQRYQDVPFSGPKWPICHEQNVFGTNHYYYFHLPIYPFHCAKFKKIPTTNPELWGCTILGPKMVHLPPQKNFFGKIITIILIYLLAPFIVQNFKEFFQRIQSYEDAQFLGLKWPISPNENFSPKTC